MQMVRWLPRLESHFRFEWFGRLTTAGGFGLCVGPLTRWLTNQAMNHWPTAISKVQIEHSNRCNGSGASARQQAFVFFEIFQKNIFFHRRSRKGQNAVKNLLVYRRAEINTGFVMLKHFEKQRTPPTTNDDWLRKIWRVWMIFQNSTSNSSENHCLSVWLLGSLFFLLIFGWLVL